ncbi:MAG TPA: urease accessory protein UreD [Trichocoleus sp.]|jgi:urease accessory protein
MSSVISAAAWCGRLELEYADRQGKTIPSRVFGQAPLKVQRPFYPEDESVCHSVILHTAGGIVGGDWLDLKVDLQPHTQAVITSAAAAKIYRSNGQEAQQMTHLRVGKSACLEWLPQETIVFNGANYQQRLRVDLAADAIWFGWDMTRLGRSARGEQFASGTWRSQTEVWQDDQLIWVDPQRIQGGSTMMSSLHGLAGYPVIASCAFVGRAVSKDLVATVRSVWEEDEGKASQRDGVTADEMRAEVGVTRLMSGLLCRYRGNSTIEARQWFVRVWEIMRQFYLGRSVSVPRVWQV